MTINSFKKITLSILAPIVFIVIGMVGYMPRAEASTVPLTGWAWSDNTGWISLGCATGGPTGNNICATSNYGLSVDGTTNLITGYGWSDNVGWIKFGGLSSFPGSPSSDATLQSDGSTINGWVRACAGTSAGDCSTMTPRTDGWDGWILLNGSAGGTSYAVSTLSNSTYSPNIDVAWNSDVMGWTAFNISLPSCTASGPVCLLSGGQQVSSSTSAFCATSNTACTYGCAGDGTCLPGTGDAGWFSVSQTSIISRETVRSGTTAVLYWYVPSVKTCSVTGSNGDNWGVSISAGTAQGSRTTKNITSKTVYTLKCQNTDNTNWISQYNTINLTLTPQYQEI